MKYKLLNEFIFVLNMYIINHAFVIYVALKKKIFF